MGAPTPFKIPRDRLADIKAALLEVSADVCFVFDEIEHGSITAAAVERLVDADKDLRAVHAALVASVKATAQELGIYDQQIARRGQAR